MSDTAFFHWSPAFRPRALDAAPERLLSPIRVPVTLASRDQVREEPAREFKASRRLDRADDRNSPPDTANVSVADHESGIALLILGAAALISIADNTTLMNIWSASSGWLQQIIETFIR